MHRRPCKNHYTHSQSPAHSQPCPNINTVGRPCGFLHKTKNEILNECQLCRRSHTPCNNHYTHSQSPAHSQPCPNINIVGRPCGFLHKTKNEILNECQLCRRSHILCNNHYTHSQSPAHSQPCPNINNPQQMCGFLHKSRRELQSTCYRCSIEAQWARPIRHKYLRAIHNTFENNIIFVEQNTGNNFVISYEDFKRLNAGKDFVKDSRYDIITSARRVTQITEDRTLGKFTRFFENRCPDVIPGKTWCYYPYCTQTHPSPVCPILKVEYTEIDTAAGDYRALMESNIVTPEKLTIC